MGASSGSGGIHFLSGLLLCCAAGCSSLPEKAGPIELPVELPNIILITVESLRPDHLSSYGYERPTTPAMEKLAATATLYERAYAVTSWTLPSHASLFTGLYPTTHRVHQARDRLDDSYTTLAERLAEAGYATAGIISGPLLQKQHNLHQGFEVYDESSSNMHGDIASQGDVTNPRMERLLHRFLQEGATRDRPFFLFAYLWDPHYDYIPPEPYDTMFVPENAVPIDIRGYETAGIVTPRIAPEQLAYVVSQYDGEILWTDELLGRFFDELERLDLWDGTAIILTADHGEEFFDHDRKGHKNNLYEESIHVPLFVKLPGQKEARRESRITSLVDIHPTILEIAKMTTPPELQGRSLLGPSPGQRPIYFELRTEWVLRDPASGELRYVPNIFHGVREGDHKFIKERNEKRRELYDLARDPRETDPVVTSAEEVAALERRLDARFAEMTREARRWGRADPAELTPEQEERLRSLGYVGQ